MNKWHLVSIPVCCTACMFFQPAPEYTGVPGYLFTPETQVDEQAAPFLPVNSTMHIQYNGEIDLNQDVDAYNIDLYDTDPTVIEELHDRGIFVMCYFSAGSFEDWRPDAAQFPQEILGNQMEGWPGEIWLDISRIDLLEPIMNARLELAHQKGCDGVDPDNVNGFENETGFPLNYQQQLAYNIFLSNAAHERGLAVGLKNDLSQIPDLLLYFDWAINEECFFYSECGALSLFIQAGKPVFVIEYELAPEEFCSQARELDFNAIQKNWELDAFYFQCE